jgi:hypothetical protein
MVCPRLNRIAQTFTTNKKLRRVWSTKWGTCAKGADVATALAEVFRVNKATIAMVQLMGSDGSSSHCVSVVLDARHDDVRYVVVDSNEPCAMPLTNKVLALCTASNTCSGWKSILYLIANEKLINSEARVVRSSLEHAMIRTSKNLMFSSHRTRHDTPDTDVATKDHTAATAHERRVWRRQRVWDTVGRTHG